MTTAVLPAAPAGLSLADRDILLAAASLASRQASAASAATAALRLLDRFPQTRAVLDACGDRKVSLYHRLAPRGSTLQAVTRRIRSAVPEVT